MTAPEVAAVLGLSKPTVAAALRKLESHDYVRQQGTRSGRSGQAPVVWGINENAGFVLAVDIGTQWVRLALGNLAGETVHVNRERPESESADMILQALDRGLEKILADSSLSRQAIVYTVIGSPGVVNPVTERMEYSSNLPGWSDQSTVTALKERFDGQFTVMKDVYLAALGEVQYRGKAADFVMLSVGRGVGSAIVHAGQPLHGTHGFAGEVAFLQLGSGRADGDGLSGRGPLEEAASADAMLASAAAEGSAFNTVGELIDAANAGNPAAAAALAREAQLIAYALSSLVVIVDPPLVVLTGSVGLHGRQELADRVGAELQKLLPFKAPSVETGLAGEHATLDGAQALGLDAGWDVLTGAL
jgi:predicted NBD/HSP70 family sugar kinase